MIASDGIGVRSQASNPAMPVRPLCLVADTVALFSAGRSSIGLDIHAGRAHE
jgi:hypothetical protein